MGGDPEGCCSLTCCCVSVALPCPPVGRPLRAVLLCLDDDELIVKVNKDGAPSDYIIQILEELSELVTNLPRTLESTAVCFPPEYELVPFFLERYCRWMKLTLSFHCNEPVKLSKRAQLKAVNWIEWYRGHLRTWEQRWPGTTPMRRVALRPDEPGITPAERKARTDANRKELAEIAFFEDLVRERHKTLGLHFAVLRAAVAAPCPISASPVVKPFCSPLPSLLFCATDSRADEVLHRFDHRDSPEAVRQHLGRRGESHRGAEPRRPICDDGPLGFVLHHQFHH